MKLAVRHHGTVGSTIRVAGARRRVARPKGGTSNQDRPERFQTSLVTASNLPSLKQPSEPDAIGP